MNKERWYMARRYQAMNEERCFEEYLFDNIQDVLMRVICDLDSLKYDLSILEAMKDERMSSLFGDCSFSYSDVKAESEVKKDDL